MDAPALLWAVRALWLVAPFTLLVHLRAATDGAPGALELVVVVSFWLVWAAVLFASLIPLPSTLTVVRVLMPVAPLAALIAAALDPPAALGVLGLVATTIAAVLSMAAAVGDWFVDGASYGDERRLALRPPAALLLGPIPLAWLLAVVPFPAGVLLAAGGTWVIGVPLALVGLVTAWWGALALWRLARRWAVFVPAGLTLVDAMALAEPVLMAAWSLRSLAPAEVGTTATDLTVGAPGLVLEVALTEAVEVVPVTRRGGITEAVTTDAVLFVPSRPATLLAHAADRGLPVGHE